MTADRARPPLRVDREAWLFGLIAMLAAIVTVVSAGLLAVPVGVTAAGLALAGAIAGRRLPGLVRDDRLRSVAALGALALVLAAELLVGPPASGPSSGQATLAAGAAGALAALCTELTLRRGLLSALALACVTVALAAALGDGPGVLPGVICGCPASLFALAQVNGISAASPAPAAARVGAAAGLPRIRAALRWRIVPVLLVVLVSGVGLLGTAAANEHWAGSGGALVGGGGPGGSGASGGRDAEAYLSAGTLDLRARGRLDQSPFALVPAGSPSYWRVGYLDRYTGDGWTQALTGRARDWQVSRRAPGQVLVTPRDPVIAPSPAGSASRQDPVVPLSGRTDLLVPGWPELVGSSALALPGGQLVSGPGDHFYLTGGRAGYLVVSRPIPQLRAPGADLAGNAGIDPDDPLDPRWTALPGTVPGRVLGLGRQLVGRTTDRRAAVIAVEAELHRRLTYRTDSPVPGPGVDAVDDVLFRSHTGFCEQFASAEVVLLRAGGIPARLVTGFAGGADDRAGHRILRSADAHAWVEVWFPHAGWVISDPTAGATVADAAGHSLTVLLDRAKQLASDVAWLPVSAGLLVLIVLGWLSRGRLARRAAARRRAVARSVSSATRAAALPPELPAAFGRLDAALTASGRPRSPDETFARLAERLMPLAPDVGPALAVLERACYARDLPDRDACRAASQALHRAAAAVRARPVPAAGREHPARVGAARGAGGNR